MPIIHHIPHFLKPNGTIGRLKFTIYIILMYLVFAIIGGMEEFLYDSGNLGEIGYIMYSLFFGFILTYFYAITLLKRFRDLGLSWYPILIYIPIYIFALLYLIGLVPNEKPWTQILITLLRIWAFIMLFLVFRKGKQVNQTPNTYT